MFWNWGALMGGKKERRGPKGIRSIKQMARVLIRAKASRGVKKEEKKKKEELQ